MGNLDIENENPFIALKLPLQGAEHVPAVKKRGHRYHTCCGGDRLQHVAAWPEMSNSGRTAAAESSY